MIIAIVLASGALVVLAWLVFNLAVQALPFFVGVSAASWAYAHGSGLVGAGVVGLLAGALAFAVGQTASTSTRSPVLRVSGLAAYLVPAGVAGFAVTRHIAGWTLAGEIWRTGFAFVGAIVTMLVAYARLTNASPGGPGEAFGRDRPSLPPVASRG